MQYKVRLFWKTVLTFQFLVLIVFSYEDDQAQPGYATTAPDKRGCSSKLEWSHTQTHTHTHTQTHTHTNLDIDGVILTFRGQKNLRITVTFVIFVFFYKRTYDVISNLFLKGSNRKRWFKFASKKRERDDITTILFLFLVTLRTVLLEPVLHPPVTLCFAVLLHIFY